MSFRAWMAAESTGFGAGWAVLAGAVWARSPGAASDIANRQNAITLRGIGISRIMKSTGGSFRSDLGDLVALDAHSRHQSLLAEDERIDVILRGRRRQVLRDTLIHHHDSRAHPDLEPVGLVELGQGIRVHEEHRIAELLGPRLQPDRRARVVVVPDRLALLKQRAVAELTADAQTSLGDLRKDQDRI